MVYRLAFKIEADESGVLVARDLVLAALEPLFGHVSSITVEEWLFRQMAVVPPVFRGARSGGLVEHSAGGRGRRRV